MRVDGPASHGTVHSPQPMCDLVPRMLLAKNVARLTDWLTGFERSIQIRHTVAADVGVPAVRGDTVRGMLRAT